MSERSLRPITPRGTIERSGINRRSIHTARRSTHARSAERKIFRRCLSFVAGVGGNYENVSAVH